MSSHFPGLPVGSGNPEYLDQFEYQDHSVRIKQDRGILKKLLFFTASLKVTVKMPRISCLYIL